MAVPPYASGIVSLIVDEVAATKDAAITAIQGEGTTQVAAVTAAGVSGAASATAAASSAGAAAASAAAAATGVMTSDSIKAHPFNLQYAGHTSVLKQARGSLANMLTADGSSFVVRLYIDFERMHQNNFYVVAGSGPVGSGTGYFRLMYGPRALNSGASASRQRWVWDMRRTSGTAYTVRSGVQPEVSGWYDVWVRRTTGGVFQIDSFACSDGSKAADGSASTLTQTLGGTNALTQTHFYIGTAGDVASEPTTSTAVTPNGGGGVGWDGAIAFLGFANVAPSDADCQAIALGADPLTQLGATNFTYFRRLRGTDSTSLSAVGGTSDTTAAATVIGDWLPGGTPGRQGTTDYITLDPVPDYYVYGLKPRATSERVLFSGTCGGVAFSGYLPSPPMPDYRQRRQVRFTRGLIQARWIKEDGGAWMPWTTIATTTATGVTEGRTFTGHARVAVGIKVLLQGQSQMTIFCTGTSLGTTLPNQAASLASYVQGTNNNTAFAFQMRPIGGRASLSDGLNAYVNRIQDRAGCVVQVVLNALVGTSALTMIINWTRTDPNNVPLDTQALVNFAGKDVSVLQWQHFSTHLNEGINFGVNILDPVIRGVGSNANNKFFGEGILRNGFAVAISPATRQTPTVAGPLDSADAASINIANVRVAEKAWALQYGAAYGPEITDMKVSPTDGPHQDTTSVRGNVRLGIRMAENVNRAMGFSPTADPYLTNVRFNAGKTKIIVTAVLPNLGSRLRVDDEATYAANVQGAEISTDGGVTWSRSGFTGAISTTPATRNDVEFTKTSGDWTAFAAGQVRFRYAFGAPFGWGTSVESSELIRGGLYDGTEIEGGLGLPVQPMAATIVS